MAKSNQVTNCCVYSYIRRHLLENMDDNPADGTERPPVKKKVSFAHLYIM